MSQHDFESILDDCLKTLERGGSIQSCLARYPGQAEALRPQLSLAQALRRTPVSKPRPAAQATAWQRFYQRSSDLRMARSHRGFGWLRPLAIMASVLLVLLAAGGGTIYAASKSLPDSPLYRIKLVTEDVRLWFVFDDEQKADILLDKSQTRIDEILQMVRQGKPVPANVLSALRHRTSRAVRLLEDRPEAEELLARASELATRQEELLVALWENVKADARDDYAATVATLHNARLRIRSGADAPTFSPQDLAAGVLHMSGVAEPFAPGIWRIGGVEVRIDERTFGGSDIAGGRAATLVAARSADGRLRALSLEVGPPAQEEQKVVISGVVEAVNEEEVQIAGQTFDIEPLGLDEAYLDPGRRVEITVAVDPVGDRTVATQVAALPEDEVEAADLLAYEGTIESDTPVEDETNDWLIAGQSFVVTPATEIDALAGDAVKGARVRVEAVRENGTVIAKRVIILAADQDEDAVELEGVFEGTDAEGKWQISGLLVDAPSEVPTPAEGTSVKITGKRKGGEITATDVITIQRPDGVDGLVNMRGIILRADDDRWRIGLARVELSDATIIIGEPVEGARALVWGRPSGRGTIEAVYIDVLDTKPFIPLFRRSDDGEDEDREEGSPGSSTSLD